MAMRDIHLGVKLPFKTAAEQDASEDILIRLVLLFGRINLRYLLDNPETKPLYEADVHYGLPDQVDNRIVDEDKLRKLVALLQEMKLDTETILMVFRMVNGIEVFLDLPAVYRRGKGDCNELAPIRLAELWRAGLAASPYLTKRRNERGGLTYHALILHPDNTTEDPSRILGMAGEAERLSEIRKNCERQANMLVAAEVLYGQGVPREVLVEKVDLMGFVPRVGFFRPGKIS